MIYICWNKNINVPKKYTVNDIVGKIKQISPDLEVVDVDVYSDGRHRKVLVRNFFGEYLMDLGSLLRGSKPSVISAINKLEYWDKKFNYLQPELYAKVKLLSIVPKGNKNNTVIASTEFGECKVDINSLLSGCVPTIMVAVDKDRYFEKQARVVHGDKYSYDCIGYTRCFKKIKIWCNVHQEYFYQVPSYHLSGAGCSKCGRDNTTEFAKKNPSGWSYTDWDAASKRSRNFDGFKVYIIKCWNDIELFYKVGKTYTSVSRRFREKKLMPYYWELVKEFEGDARTICELENEIKNKHKDYLYCPKISFKGEGECFSKLILTEYDNSISAANDL
jgi:hypothetical protein